MTEFESLTATYQQANLVFQESVLAYQQATIAFQDASLWAMYAQSGVALVVGLIQCGLIAWGLRLMRQSARHRDQQHEENMTALKALITGMEMVIARTAK